MNGSVAMIEHVARPLSPLSMEVVFVGGAVVRLLVTDPSATEFRTTDDVDVMPTDEGILKPLVPRSDSYRPRSHAAVGCLRPYH